MANVALCLNYGCMHHHLANHLCNPFAPKLLSSTFRCDACPMSCGQWDDIYLLIIFYHIKLSLCTVIIPKSSMPYNEVVQALWEDKQCLQLIYHWTQKVYKYHMEAALLQLIAINRLGMTVSYDANKGDAIITVVMDHDLCPMYMQQNITSGTSILLLLTSTMNKNTNTHTVTPTTNADHPTNVLQCPVAQLARLHGFIPPPEMHS